MHEVFEDEFVSWRHNTPVGVKVDEVFGMDSKSGKVWLEMARQIFCELGEPNYREIGHYESGAPFIYFLNARLSITHTSNLFIGAFLPKTPDQNLEVFNPRTAMGIDAEKIDRSQVLKIRSKFLSEKERDLVPEDNLEANILAWTSKEALYKAALTPGLDFKENIIITKLPEINRNLNSESGYSLGSAILYFPDNTIIQGQQNMELYSYETYGCCVTIAISPKCAKFKTNR